MFKFMCLISIPRFLGFSLGFDFLQQFVQITLRFDMLVSSAAQHPSQFLFVSHLSTPVDLVYIGLVNRPSFEGLISPHHGPQFGKW